MPNLTDPHAVHELLVIALLAVMFPTFLVLAAYINVLNAFFGELKAKEPDVWKSAGSPRLLDMLVMPFLRFRKYYAFLPTLRERAVRKDGSYRYAQTAYLLFMAGMAMCAMLFMLAALVFFWIIYFDL